MTRRCAAGVLLALTLCLPRPTAAESAVRAALLAESTTWTPGTSCWLALRFQVDEGWHLYWANPGDNGMAPSVQWLLPAGFAVRALHWPAPRRFGEAPSVSYGLDGEVVLLAELRTPDAAPAAGSGPMRLGARIKWLVCREACVPGQADVALDLAAGGASAPDPAVTGLFARARAALPAPLPVKARLVGDDARLTLFLDLPTGDGAPRGAYFYSADLETVDHSGPQTWLADARGARLVIPASPYARTPAARLRGVLRVEYPAPVHWSLDLPVQKQTLQGDPR